MYPRYKLQSAKYLGYTFQKSFRQRPLQPYWGMNIIEMRCGATLRRTTPASGGMLPSVLDAASSGPLSPWVSSSPTTSLVPSLINVLLNISIMSNFSSVLMSFRFLGGWLIFLKIDVLSVPRMFLCWKLLNRDNWLVVEFWFACAWHVWYFDWVTEWMHDLYGFVYFFFGFKKFYC